VQKEHNQIAVASRFEFRAGLHTGPVFKYSDINERLNYAGSGINLAQRAMAPGNAWHLLATQDARENVIQGNGRLARVFHKLQRTIMTKHGEELVVYNVYDREGHGNPEEPLI
jgi:class 3 adenylate cyclase